MIHIYVLTYEKVFIFLASLSLSYLCVIFSACDSSPETLKEPIASTVSASVLSEPVSDGDVGRYQAQKVYEARNEVAAVLDFISQGLAYLTEDASFSSVVSDMCLKNASTSDYKVLLSAAAQRYEYETGRDIIDVMRARSMQYMQDFDWESYGRMMNGFVVNGVALQPEIYLGFLNDSGDFEQAGWDRQSVAFVGYGQMGDWAEIPGWLSGAHGVSRSLIAIEDMYKMPMWEVAAHAEFMNGLSNSDYQAFAIPTAKCYCIGCLESSGEMCQRSANPLGGECSCKTGGACPGNCVDPTN